MFDDLSPLIAVFPVREAGGFLVLVRVGLNGSKMAGVVDSFEYGLRRVGSVKV